MADLVQLEFNVPFDVVDAVIDMLCAEAGGVEIRDRETVSKAAGDGATVVTWVPAGQVEGQVLRVGKLVGDHDAANGKRPWTWTQSMIRDEDWQEKYKQYCRVNKVGRKLVIKPTWEEYRPTGDEVVIEIDPGAAFGTSQHASTRLMLSALERTAYLDNDPQRILDVGCGSGILSITAAKLWPDARVTAIDCDDVAIETAKANATRLNLDDRVEILREIAGARNAAYNLVMANLDYETLLPLKTWFASLFARERGTLIVSGLLADQATKLSAHYAGDLTFLPEYSEESDDGWRVVLFRTPRP